MARTTRTRVPEELFPRVAMIIEKAGKTTDDFTEILRNGSAYGLPDDYQVGDQTVEAKLTRTPDGFEYDDEGTIYENVNGEKVEISVQEFKRRLQLPKDHPEFIENKLGTNMRVILGVYGDDFHERKPFNIPGATGRQKLATVKVANLDALAEKLGLTVGA